MINNFEQIKNILKFESEDDFYFIQILKRRKENPEMGSNSALIKSYYIKSIEHFEKVMPEIITLCNATNARAGINLNKRSFKQVALQMLKKVTDCVIGENFKSVKNGYDSVCGKFTSEPNKSWIVDIDVKAMVFVGILTKKMETLQPLGDKIKSIIETKNGYHLITKPFNIKQFDELFDETFAQFEKPDIHKNNPTILYIPHN